jgi:hypothetical protein
MRVLVLAAIVVAFGGANCWARDFTVKDFSTVECGTTLYAWSETAGKAPAEIATGVVKDAADGQGKWMKGHLTLEILSPLNTAPEKETCVYDLVGGGYTVNPDGSGISRNSWKLAAGSDPRCASLHLDWFAKGGVDASLKSHNPGEAVESIYMNGPNDGYQMAIGPAGFGTGTCKSGK